MVSIKQYTRELIKTASVTDVAKRGVKAVRVTAKDIIAALKKAKTVTPQDIGAIESFKKSLTGRTLGLAGKAVKGVGKAAKWSVTHKGKFSPAKALIMGAPVVGAYKGIQKGRAKIRNSKYHGPDKPSVVYQDPRRRLY